MENATPVNVDSFFAAFAACKDEVKKQRALAAALDVLTSTGTNDEKALSLRELTIELRIGYTSGWRYKFPYHTWAGRKVYYLSECRAYMDGADLQARLAVLAKSRKAAKKAKAAQQRQEGAS